MLFHLIVIISNEYYVHFVVDIKSGLCFVIVVRRGGEI